MEALRAGKDPRRVGPYELLARLGGGRISAAYLGRLPGGEAVVVRVMNREFAADEAFRRHLAETAAGLRGVGDTFTAAMVEVNTQAKRPWLACAFLVGLPLTEAVDTYGVLPPESVTALAVGLARALQGLHAAGVVHGGLKPSKVLLATDGPRVVGPGLVPAAEASALAGRGVLVESPEFMAPEQLFGSPAQAASDVFRLGAVLVFAATGHPPFGEGSRHELARRVQDEEPDLEGLTPPLRELIARCLAVEPPDRPPLTDLLGALTALVGPALAATENDADHDGPPAADWLPSELAAAARAHQQATIAPQRPMVSRRHLIISALAWTAIGTVAAGAGTISYRILRPPRAEADWYGGIQPGWRVGLHTSVREGTLIGPHFHLRVLGIAVTEELSQLVAVALKLYEVRHAAEGQEFVIVTFDGVEDDTPWQRDLKEMSQKKVSLTVETGGRTRSVTTYPRRMHNETAGPATLALSVPKGAPVTLRVTDDGRTQSMDLRTGRRGNDAIAAYYKPLPKLKVTAEDYEATAQVSVLQSTRPVRLGVRFVQTEAYVGPWVRPAGWARPGRWWVMLRRAEVYTGFATAEQQSKEYKRSRLPLSGEVHYADSFTLHSGGTTYQPTGANTIDWTEVELPSVYSYSVVFDVPEGWHEGGTLIFRPKVSLSADLPAAEEAVSVPVTWNRRFPEHQIRLTPTDQ